MYILSESNNLCNYVGISKEGAFDIVIDWFNIRGNIETKFNINNDVYSIIKNKQCYLLTKNKRELFSSKTKINFINRLVKYKLKG